MEEFGMEEFGIEDDGLIDLAAIGELESATREDLHDTSGGLSVFPDIQNGHELDT